MSKLCRFRSKPPAGALADGRVAVGTNEISRSWLAGPTDRYAHGVLGDAIEAESLVVERKDGRRDTLSLSNDAVFEDLEPRLAKFGGRERIVVVKSYLDRGSALAIVDPETMTILAETPPIGRPNAWLNPAEIADFDGDGITDIALVRQPHVVGRLELWSWRKGGLEKTTQLEDVSNHVIGSRSLALSAVADFNQDGHPDLAIPSRDRLSLRLITFVPSPHDIARVKLPARIVTNLVTIEIRGRAATIAGLETGTAYPGSGVASGRHRHDVQTVMHFPEWDDEVRSPRRSDRSSLQRPQARDASPKSPSPIDRRATR